MPDIRVLPKQLHLIKLLVPLSLITTAFICGIIKYELHYLHAENGLLENLQAAILMAGILPCLVFRTATPGIMAFNQAFALLCFSFLLRELDVEYLDVPLLIKMLGSGVGKVVLLILLWAGFAVVVLRKGYITAQVVHDFLESNEFKVLLLAVLLLAVSAVMDREVFSLQFSRLYEETAEIDAYLLMVLSSVMRWLPSEAFVQHDQYQG